VRRQLACGVVLCATIAIAAFDHLRSAWATSPVGFSTTTLMKTTVGEVEVLNDAMLRDAVGDEPRAKAWLSRQKTKGQSNLYVQSNIWQPGGSTGWHSHPGNSLIIVIKGTVTDYDGSDPGCKPHLYSQDMTFEDHGGEHVHLIRNEGAVVAQTTAIQLIPAGAERRIDVRDPGNCLF
jgi:hypothetical protein